MKKRLLMGIAVLTALSTAALAVGTDGGLGAPGVEGIGKEGSKTEVRVKANVVAGVAVNEAEPIDFGNLVRGAKVYTANETINSRTPGRVVFRADQEMVNKGKVYANLEKATTDLTWRNNNGSDGSGNRMELKNVVVKGLGISPEAIELDQNGQAEKKLDAYFYAYDNGNGQQDTTNGNLGANQKLGSYLGTVTVQATIK